MSTGGIWRNGVGSEALMHCLVLGDVHNSTKYYTVKKMQNTQKRTKKHTFKDLKVHSQVQWLSNLLRVSSSQAPVM